MLRSLFTPVVRSVNEPADRLTAIQRAISLLRRFGSDAHLWLPGVGTLNGLTCGNYLESTGNTLLTVDNPAGLVLDALGSVGDNLFSDAAVLFSGESSRVSSGVYRIYSSAGSYSQAYFGGITAGKRYIVTFTIDSITTVGSGIQVEGGGTSVFNTIGIKTEVITASVTTVGIKRLSACDYQVSNISVIEVTGIHLTQATTANKGVLRLTSGRYNWVFDATDLLTGTFPAGYESVTVIDAKSTGQVTTAAANIVGSYSIGPSYTSYGRIVVKGSLTASELTLLQGFANKLAGL